MLESSGIRSSRNGRLLTQLSLPGIFGLLLGLLVGGWVGYVLPYRQVHPASANVVESFQPGDIQVFRTRTPVPFLWAVHLYDPAFYGKRVTSFAAGQTAIFHNILKDRCVDNGKSALVIDIGGNLGYFSLLAASYGCRVRTVEPQPPLQNLFRISIKLNGWEDRITLFPNAAGQRSGDIVQLPLLTDHMRASVLPADTHHEAGNYFNVTTLRVDELITEDILLLKVDVEGYEDEVWKGIDESTLEKMKIEHMFLEMKKQGDARFKSEWVKARLTKGGYDVTAYHPEYSKIHRGNFTFDEFGYIFYPVALEMSDKKLWWPDNEDLWLHPKTFGPSWLPGLNRKGKPPKRGPNVALVPPIPPPVPKYDTDNR